MLKSIQIKIVMIFAILGIIVISALGLFSVYQLETAISELPAQEVAAMDILSDQAKNIEIEV